MKIFRCYVMEKNGAQRVMDCEAPDEAALKAKLGAEGLFLVSAKAMRGPFLLSFQSLQERAKKIADSSPFKFLLAEVDRFFKLQPTVGRELDEAERRYLHRKREVVLGALAAVVTFLVIFLLRQIRLPTMNPSKILMAHRVGRIETGMTRAEVEKIMRQTGQGDSRDLSFTSYITPPHQLCVVQYAVKNRRPAATDRVIAPPIAYWMDNIKGGR